MGISVVLPRGPMDLNFGRASQIFDGFVEGRRTKVDPMGFGRTMVDSLKVGELLLILQCIGELKSILWSIPWR